MRHDVTDAEASLRRAVALEPETALYREWLGKLLIWTGRFAEALAEARRAVELAPLSPTSNAEVARALLANGRCDEALAQLEKLTDLEPPLARVAAIQAQCYIQKRMWPEALAATRPSVEQGQMFYSGLHGYALAGAGRREEATRFLNTLLEREPTDPGLSWHIALVYLGLGELDRAVPWLDRAAEGMAITAGMEMAPTAARLLDSLRGDPRIARIRRRMGLHD
jgi:predicted Zn-dependent protease